MPLKEYLSQVELDIYDITIIFVDYNVKLWGVRSKIKFIVAVVPVAYSV